MELLPQNLKDELVSLGQIVDLKVGNVLVKEGNNASYIYFPFSSYISLVATVDQHEEMEIAIIGNEGMLGVTLLSGISTAPLIAVVQGPGTALKISVLTIQEKCDTHPILNLLIKKSVSLLLAQVVSTATCAKFHALKPRLAKRLLEVHDRIDSDNFHVTHRVLSNLLGVRRSAVSIGANALKLQNCIRYSRGKITVLDRLVLEAEACSCYVSLAAS